MDLSSFRLKLFCFSTFVTVSADFKHTSTLGMKTKVFTVVPVEDYGYDTEQLKSTLRISIDRRLELMKNQRRLIRKPKSQSAIRKKAKSSRKKNINPRRIKFLSGNPTSDDLMPHINNAMKVQQTVYEASLEMNKLYRLPMLFIFLEAFLTFTFNLYFMLCVMADPKKFKLPQWESIGFLSQHLIQPSVCVTVIVVAFTAVKNEFKKSQSLVNKIIIHSVDSDIRSRFLEFSQQIQSNAPHFNVFEFFVLDGSVIFSMISAGTTYLIILIQAMANETDDNPLFQIVANTNGSAKLPPE